MLAFGFVVTAIGVAHAMDGRKKMRLIDADRLLKPSFTDMFDKPVKMTMFSRYAIESQPTVKAIPIEWIEHYYKFRLMPKPVEWFEAIEIMLTDWEKENE